MEFIEIDCAIVNWLAWFTIGRNNGLLHYWHRMFKHKPFLLITFFISELKKSKSNSDI